MHRPYLQICYMEDRRSQLRGNRYNLCQTADVVVAIKFSYENFIAQVNVSEFSRRALPRRLDAKEQETSLL